ncbi:hypothetical protein ACLB2K_052197 [Fragaria x ananassa]
MLTGVLPSSLGGLFGEAEASTGTVLGMAFIGAGMHLPTTYRVGRREDRQPQIWQQTDADEISTAWRRGSNKFSIRIGSVSSDLGMSPVYIVASSRSDVVIGLWRAVVRLREGGGYRVWMATTVGAVGLGRWWLTTRDPLLPRWYRVKICLVANYHVVVHDVFKGSHKLAVIRNHLLVYIFINKRFKVDLLCVRLTDVDIGAND